MDNMGPPIPAKSAESARGVLPNEPPGVLGRVRRIHRKRIQLTKQTLGSPLSLIPCVVLPLQGPPRSLPEIIPFLICKGYPGHFPIHCVCNHFQSTVTPKRPKLVTCNILFLTSFCFCQRLLPLLVLHVRHFFLMLVGALVSVPPFWLCASNELECHSATKGDNRGSLTRQEHRLRACSI